MVAASDGIEQLGGAVNTWPSHIHRNWRIECSVDGLVAIKLKVTGMVGAVEVSGTLPPEERGLPAAVPIGILIDRASA